MERNPTAAAEVLPTEADVAALRAIREIVEVYFMPWGAAKAVLWEDLTDDRPFSGEVAMDEIQRALGMSP